jgi:hypothetical protein
LTILKPGFIKEKKIIPDPKERSNPGSRGTLLKILPNTVPVPVPGSGA